MNTYQIRPSDISTVVDQLRAMGADRSYAVLMFKTPYALPDENPYINLQYSIIDSVLGLDFVLLGERNIDDAMGVYDFMQHVGHVVTYQELNGVRFLRTDDGDLVKLGGRLIKEYYLVDGNPEIELLVEGFDFELHQDCSICLLYTSPSPRDGLLSRMPSSA